MTTGYNLPQAMARAREADRTSIRDPDPLLVIQVSETDFGYVELKAALAYTLQPAAQVPLGIQVTCNPTIAGVTVNGTAIADGDYRDFRVVLDNSATPVRVWKLGATD